ncbi:unnamed protein product [Trichogramma brassicae]|uniref:Uncharacterized protein n=1 Tax=Trichogramma brassicae TaxID=86971 RepID=A0A6H5IST3_9HYME|nr:unnamed protein product [Trichogramma brassicae]
MDWLLEACIKWSSWSLEIVEFVAHSGYKDQPDLDEDGKPRLCRTTAVHKIAECHQSASTIKVLENLFKIYDKFHVNYTDESGYSHFHMACKYGLDHVAEKFLELGQDPDCLDPKTGNSILYFVAAKDLTYSNTSIILLLLKHGADASQTKDDGTTPLHVICQHRDCTTYSVISMLLESVDELQQTVLINAQDKWGDTPLHLALKDGYNIGTVQELLRRGANLNLANAQGQTPLHVICQSDKNSSLLKLFFDFIDAFGNTVQIDARNKEGNTPLHLAISWGDAKMVESLLIRGADPCLDNAEGLPPLHLIARRDVHGDMMQIFLSTNKERQQTVGIDGRDKSGRTALEWAVMRCLPLAVVSLLDCGADVSSFVFPTPSDSDEYGDINPGGLLDDLDDADFDEALLNDLDDADFDEALLHDLDDDDSDYHVLDSESSLNRLTTVTGLLAIVELLESRGYEMSREDGLKLMELFDKYGLYESTNFSTSKDVDDLVDSLFEQMAKKRTYMDDFKFVSSYEFHKIAYESMEACSVRLCEKILTKFCRDWAMGPFMELIHYRLPILCCEMIIETLKNKDLFNVCLAVAGPTRIDAAANAADFLNILIVIGQKIHENLITIDAFICKSCNLNRGYDATEREKSLRSADGEERPYTMMIAARESLLRTEMRSRRHRERERKRHRAIDNVLIHRHNSTL